MAKDVVSHQILATNLKKHIDGVRRPVAHGQQSFRILFCATVLVNKETSVFGIGSIVFGAVGKVGSECELRLLDPVFLV